MSRARSDRGAAKAPAKDAPKAAGGARGASDWLSSVVAKVPARIMEPRLTLILATTALVVFGLVMVYSASSVKGIILSLIHI